MPERNPLAQTFSAPETPVQEKLCEIWAEVLHLDQVGIDDDFFALGGHSISALQAISRVQAAFDVRFPARAIFEGATVRHTASLVEDALLAEIEGMAEEDAGARLFGPEQTVHGGS